MIVADVYLRRLGSFCLAHKITPGDYARLPKRKMEEMAFDFVQEMEAKVNPSSGGKYAPSYVDSNLKAILSWARWNRKGFEMRIKIADSSKRPTLENERVPTNDELRRVLYADTTPLRTRASIAIMAFAGCRPEVQGNYMGLDGLKVKDLPELVIDDGKVSFTKVPTLVIVRAELSKSRHWYPTFILEEGCEILKQYLERRLTEGEKLTRESGIITSDASAKEKLTNLKVIIDASPLLRTTKLGHHIRKAMRAAGLPWRPYVFRSYFDTALLLGESKGMASHAYQQCWMGHKGSIEATYTLRKGELPAELLEDMRSAYGKVADELLGTTRKSSEASKEMIMETFNRQYLTMAGFSEDEMSRMGDLSQLAPQQIQDMVKQKSMQALGLNGNSSQKVIPTSEVRNFVIQGWEFVNFLPDNEAIVRLPLR
jgi:integrase